MLHKVCYHCNQVKPVKAFNRASKTTDRHQTMCRACFSAYNRAHYRAQIR
jgi:hypothetical protein